LSDNNRKAKYYEITKRGRELIAQQQETWNRLSTAVQSSMRIRRALSRHAGYE
jgi:DNA-binding PadR family transcriptional regulator